MPHDEALRFFAKLIEKELGIVYAEHNYFQLQNRLEEIAKLQGMADITALHEMAKNGLPPTLKQLLLDVATNNETSFFRDPKIFQALEATLLAGHPPGSPLRIWSAASSTGQEAISISIMILEFCAKNKIEIPFSILATDISERVLARAAKGTYSQLEVQRGLPAAYLVKYFKKVENEYWKVNDTILSKIEFRKQNLKEAFPFRESFDLILCRNVLIYQSVPGKIEIVKRLTALLKNSAYLVLGSGESLLGISSDYEQRNAAGVIVFSKKAQQELAA